MKKTISIEGMSCNHCVMAVKNALSGLEGVKSVNVDLTRKLAIVEGEGIADELLMEAIDDVGYEVMNIEESW